jgi:alkylhydroperoxidase/carboxymuconolactone decarboxylase family protein YurZ
MSTSDLKKKYGDDAFAAGLALQPTTFERRLAQRDRLDQHFTQLWLDFQVRGMSRRSVLDTRTRLLVQIGQFTMAKAHGALEEGVRAALAADVDAREILEIILQCTIYGGQTTVDPAIEIFDRIAGELGLHDELKASQLPLDGNDATRSLDEERKRWHRDDAADPRAEQMIERHGWLAVSSGMMLRPRHHLGTLSWQDALDFEWADLWVKWIYQGLYTRRVVDDKTRILCMVGNCVAVGETVQSLSHMRGAMRAGAKPREVLEVILQSSVNFGMPSGLAALRAFVRIMRDDGRLDEIGNPPQRHDE